MILIKCLGSPPLTRETQEVDGVGHATIRITPAYAGNTLRMYRTTQLMEDHPRLRGKH